MPGNLGMTITEAEAILGISVDASRDDIQSAYRDMAKRYHPDAWVNASPSARKKAERTYKKLSVAKRVLMNPSLAKSEPGAEEADGGYHPSTDRADASSRSTGDNQSGRNGYENASYHQPNGGHDGTRARASVTNGGGSRAYTPYREQVRVPGRNPRPDFNSRVRTSATDNTPPDVRDGSWASTGSTQAERDKYNQAKSFTDQFGSVRDTEEDDYASQYRRYANGRYRRGSDAIRWSSSIVTTVLAAMLSILIALNDGLFTQAFGGGNDAIGIDLTPLHGFIVMMVVCLGKLLVYDFVSCHYIRKSLVDSGHATFVGMPFAIGGVAIFMAGFLVVSPSPLFIYCAIACVVASVIIGVIANVTAKDAGLTS